jgi:2'-5' RNA ligase
MKSVILLICDNFPKYLKDFRLKYDIHKKFPAHITLFYLKKTYNETEIINKLKKIKKINITLDKVIKKKDILYLKPKNNDKLKNITSQFKNDIKSFSKSGYHLTLRYNQQDINIPKEEIDKISIPLTLQFSKIWLVKKKESNWYRAKTIFLI